MIRPDYPRLSLRESPRIDPSLGNIVATFRSRGWRAPRAEQHRRLHVGVSTASRTASRFCFCQLFSDLLGPDLIVDFLNESVFIEVSGQA